jgi:MFS transporter, YNFM family, putative membrane transport protein
MGPLPAAGVRSLDELSVGEPSGDGHRPEPAPGDRYLREHGRLMVALLAMAGLAALAQFSVWIPTAELLVRTFPAAAGGVAAVGSLFGLAYAVGALVVGPLADRYGRRRVLLGGLFGLAAATVAAAASPTWPLHLGARVAQGLIAVAIPVAGLTWVATVLPPRQRLLAAAVLTAAWQGANQAGQAYGQVLAAAGWRTVQVSLAVGYVLAAVAVVTHMADVRFDATSAATTVVDVLRRVARLARRPPVVACWLLAGLLQGSVFAMYVGLERYMPDPGLLLWARLAGLAGVAITPLVVVRVRTGPLWLIMTSVAVAAGGLLTQAMVPRPAATIAGSVLVGFGTTLALPPLVAVLTRLAVGVEASALAVYGACLAVGASLGVQLPGWLPPWLGFPVLAAALAAALATGAVVLWATEPERQPSTSAGTGPAPVDEQASRGKR